MKSGFKNVYEDSTRAAAYAKLEYPGTYYLAFRDLPEIIQKHVSGRTAMDFGCGAGRSTRFLRKLGFEPVGVDISAAMLSLARANDPDGNYRLVPNDDLSDFHPGSFDLILSAFTFDNVTMEKKEEIFRSLKTLLKPDGRILNLVSSAEIYFHEWLSFSTRDFPENRMAKSGDLVRIVMLDVEDRRPVEDIICRDEDYSRIFANSDLKEIEIFKPLGKENESYSWVSETRIAPWVIHVLGPGEG